MINLLRSGDKYMSQWMVIFGSYNGLSPVQSQHSILTEPMKA